MTTAPTEIQKKECKDDDSSDSDDEDETKRHKMNLDEDTKQLNTIFELGEDDFKSDEEDKIQMPKKEATQNTVDFRSREEWSLSATSTRVFIPSVQKSKEKGFEVDEKGLLRIPSFDDMLNLKLSSGLSELFRKISIRFKQSPKMDTTTYIKTLRNMYFQHYNKLLKQTGGFNDRISAILFPQILRFMYDKNFIKGKFLTQIIENGIFDLEEIEEASKIIVDWDGLNKIFKEYSSTPEQKGTVIDDDKLELTLAIAKMLFTDLSKSSGLPKNKFSMLKKIGSIIRMYSNKVETNSAHTNFLDRNKQVRNWIFDLLLKWKIVTIYQAHNQKLHVDSDAMSEFLSHIENDIESCKREVSQMGILN